MKICSKCKGDPQPLDNFHKSKRLSQGRRAWCKVCERDQHKEWVELNPEKIAAIDKKYNETHPGVQNAKHKEWMKQHPEVVNAKRLKKRYGLSMDQYRSLFVAQNDSCAICKRNKTINELGLHVDHNHNSGKVRGLLCPSCNQALGLLQDNPELCRLAAIYIEDDGKLIEPILGGKHGEEKTYN